MERIATIIYIIFGCFWVLLSEYAINMVYSLNELSNLQLIWLNIGKGLFFILISSFALYIFVKGRERTLNQLFENSPFASWVFDEKSKKLYNVNKIVQQQYGYSREELFKENKIDFKHPNQKELLLTHQLTQDKSLKIHQHKNGEALYMRIYDQEFYHAGKKLKIINAINVTDKINSQLRLKTLNDELKHKEQFLNSLLNAQTNFAIIRTDLEGNYTYINEAFERTYGYNKEDLLGKPSLPTVHPEDHDSVHKMVEYCLKYPGIPFNLPIRKPHNLRKGEILFTEWDFVGITNENDDVIAIQGVGKNVTLEKTFTGKLLAYRQKMDRLMDQIEDIVWSCDADTYEILYINNACEKIFGYSQDEMLRNPQLFFNAVHPEDKAKFLAHLEELKKESKGNKIIEYRLIDKNGELHILNDKAYYSIDKESGKGYLSGVTSDITEQKRLQEEHQKIENLLKETSSIAKVGGWEIDIKSKKTYWTEQVYAIHELPLTYNHNIENVFSFYDDATQKFLTKVINDCMVNQQAFDVTVQLKAANGKKKWIRATGESNKNKSKITGLFQDITAQKLAQEKLEKSMHRVDFYRRAIDSTAIVSITDPNGVIKYVNDKFIKDTGYNYLELVGFKHSKLDSSHHPLPFWQNLWHTIKSGKVWRGEIRNRKKSGDYYWVETFIVPNVKENEDEIIEFLSISYNITERKHYEQALEQSNQTKEILLKELHHRVKNNLQLIKSMFYMESIKEDSTTGRTFLDNMQKRMESMSLVHEHFMNEKELRYVSLNGYMQSLFDKLVSMSNSEGIFIQTELDIEEIGVDIEKMIIIGLIVNELFTNAQKHAFPDRKEGVISCAIKMKVDGLIHIYFKDNGIGLNENIFEKENMGKGSLLVKLFVEQLRGQINVESKHQQGTKISIQFKL